MRNELITIFKSLKKTYDEEYNFALKNGMKKQNRL